MKYSFLLLFLFASLASVAQMTYDNLYVDYDSAWTYKNLKIIPVRPKKRPENTMPGVISLSQALQRGLATVSERGTASTENVHFLRINNQSDKTIYISSGEIIAGGRQDRMVARDTLLVPSGKDQYIPVMCVEENRWSDKEKKFVYGNFADPRLRKILDQNKNQVLIWNEIGNQLSDGQVKNKTLAYLSKTRDKKLSQANDEYYRYFIDKFKQADSNRVGFICVSGDKIIGTDIFATQELFYSQLEPLLKGYTDAAVLYGSSINMSDKDLKLYMDKLLSTEKGQEDFVKYNGKIFRQDGKPIHINTF